MHQWPRSEVLKSDLGPVIAIGIELHECTNVLCLTYSFKSEVNSSDLEMTSSTSMVKVRDPVS